MFARNLILCVASLFVIFVFISCANSDRSASSTNGDHYSDGDYCADVHYYNPNTGKQSDYTLNVYVEDGKLTIIHWPNGGWLDQSHFSPEDIRDGDASFTSDKGYEYTVQLNERGHCKN